MSYKKKEVIGDATLYLGDCLEILPTLDKVDAVITDPPYGKVKGEFDYKWTNRSAMLKDVVLWIDAMHGAIKFNGTLWWFAWPSLAGKIEYLISEKMNTLAHVVWVKPNGGRSGLIERESLRAPAPESERIIMAEHYGADNAALGESGYMQKCDDARAHIFEPIRAYLAEEWGKAGLTNKDANQACGNQMAGHYFTTTQWTLPTKENYEKLQKMATGHLKKDYEDLKKDYEDLKKDYEDLKKDYEDLRRYFDCRYGDQHTDIWRFKQPSVRYGHPTEKPVEIMEHIVKLSIRRDGVCLDPFMGSGTTGVACMNLGRKFIGIEIEPKYFDIACERIENAQKQGRLFE